VKQVFPAFLIVMTSLTTWAVDRSLENFLVQFHANPRKMINKMPFEIRNHEVIDRGFINDELIDARLITEKQALREEIIKKSLPFISPYSAAADGDNAAAIVDNGVLITNIFDLDQRGTIQKTLTQKFWSDSYWPIAQGLIANRYSIADNPRDKTNWQVNYDYFQANPPWTVSTSLLSPAEKYDLLVGDQSMSLTQYAWNRGRTYNETHDGVVPSWMGICHGWSAATHMEAPIPYGSITLKSPTGTSIRFFQSDIKALTSLLWANTDLPTRFLGYRCNISPARDNQGRTVDDKCRDNNPSTLFLALTNQLGLNNRSVVVDATYDAEVWNFSVVGYRSIYFNPQTFQQTSDLRQAIVPISSFTIDKFKKYRAPGTAYVVGLTMDMTHLNESGATHGIQTTPRSKVKRYIMDLELDAQYNVIGGEWYSRVHPDFIWTFALGSQAQAPGDADIVADDWNVKESVPPEWTAAARKSSRVGMPLYSVIKRIVQAAPKTPPSNSSDETVEPPSPGENSTP
jgi:hypothetical protein